MRGDHEGGSMKAWRVRDEAAEEGYCTVVFAETRGKAHALAMSTDCCEDAEWNDVSVRRISEMDKMYKGRKDGFYDRRLAIVRFSDYVKAEIDMISADEMQDIRKYNEETFNLYGVKFAAEFEE